MLSINSVWTDVTAIVKPVVDGAPTGDVAFTAAEPNNTFGIDGEILAVIMNDPTLPTDNTVSFQFGALNSAGDTYSIGLSSPLNLGDPNLALTMSIGDSFGYQSPAAQFSNISVNGTLMTSDAGGNDDAICKNDTPLDFGTCGDGELITVGGIGDSTSNPPDPSCVSDGRPRCDDELYNLLPFVHNGDTTIQVNTDNPSNDDNIFFTGFQLNSTAAVVGEGAVLTPVSGTNPVNSPYTLTAKVQDSVGTPIANKALVFTVLSGPNAGTTGSATTDANGNATFTYTSTTSGTDTVQVSFTGSATVLSNQATIAWTAVVSPTPTTLTTTLSGAAQTGATITVPAGTAVTDSAALSGANAAIATGTVSYNVYSDAACATLVSAAGGGNVVNGAVPSSSPQTLTAPGIYYWTAAYSGDTTNQPSSSACGSETVTVTAVNRPPTADAKAVTTPQNTPVPVTLTGTDPDGNSLTFAVVTSPTHGTLSGLSPNLTYTPAAGYSGPDSFTYKANDGKADSAPATVSITVTPTTTGCSRTAPTVDVTVSADQKTPAAKLTSGKVTSSGSNELVLAFIEADGPQSPTQKVTGFTGGGLTWTLAARSNATWGTTEVWQAYATSPLSNAVVTAKLASAYDGSITVTAFKGAAKKVGGVASGAGTTGQPTAALTPTSCNSLVWAAGHDWTHNTAAVPATGQTIVHQFVDGRVHDSFWTQKVNAPTVLGVKVAVKDTVPTKDRWTLAAVEVPPAV